MIANAAALLMAAILVADGGATGVLSEIRPQNNPTVIQPEEVLDGGLDVFIDALRTEEQTLKLRAFGSDG